MEKSIYSEDYTLFLQHLRCARKSAGLTQQQLGERLGQTQSFVSKCERGDRRIDIAELRVVCSAIGIAFGEFIDQLDAAIENRKA